MTSSPDSQLVHLLKEEILSPLNKTINPSETKIKKNNKREETAPASKNDAQISSQNQQLDTTEEHQFVSDRIPMPFVELVKCFFPTAVKIEEFWRMATITAYKNNQEDATDTILSVSLESFKQLVRKLKSTKKVKNPVAYYTGILKKKFQEIYFAELFEMGFAVAENSLE